MILERNHHKVLGLNWKYPRKFCQLLQMNNNKMIKDIYYCLTKLKVPNCLQHKQHMHNVYRIDIQFYSISWSTWYKATSSGFPFSGMGDSVLSVIRIQTKTLAITETISSELLPSWKLLLTASPKRCQQFLGGLICFGIAKGCIVNNMT